MIKIDTRELDQFSVRLGKISGEAKNNVNEVIKNSAFKIEKDKNISTSFVINS